MALAPTTGKLSDPAWRRERAIKAAKARVSLDHHVAQVVAKAGELTPEHVERLRSLLPEAGPR